MLVGTQLKWQFLQIPCITSILERVSCANPSGLPAVLLEVCTTNAVFKMLEDKRDYIHVCRNKSMVLFMGREKSPDPHFCSRDRFMNW